MTPTGRRIAIALAILSSPLSAAQAEGPYRAYRAYAAPEPIVTTEAGGCYWYRQRQYCSRYCYVEVNGQRYCREREREAFPQAPADATVYLDPLGPFRMKLGAGQTGR